MQYQPQTILVVHVAGPAQTVLALPALRALRRHWPAARITVTTSPAAAELLRLARCADEVLAVGRLRMTELTSPRALYGGGRALRALRRGQFDLGIELKRDAESALLLQLAQPRERVRAGVLERVSQALTKNAPRHLAHEYLQRLEPLGVRPVEANPRLATDRAADERFEQLLIKHGVPFGALLVGIHPGSSPRAQRWPVELFVSMATRLIHNFGAQVLVFAGPNERGLARKVAAALPAKRAIAIQSPQMPDFVSALARLSLCVANHGGPAHIAAAAGAPVVVAAPFAAPAPTDVLGERVVHVRRAHAELIPEEEMYEAACRLLKTNRAELLIRAQ